MAPQGFPRFLQPTSVGIERAQFQGWDAHLCHHTALVRTVWRLFPTSAGLHLLHGDMDRSAETHFSLGHFFSGNFTVCRSMAFSAACVAQSTEKKKKAIEKNILENHVLSFLTHSEKAF